MVQPSGKAPGGVPAVAKPKPKPKAGQKHQNPETESAVPKKKGK